jgi:non-heme chloroperoxidase
MSPSIVTQSERAQVDRANASGKQPIVFVHRLWLLPSSWDRWAAAFEDAGYVAISPGWPDDPPTVAEANAHPEVSPARRSLRSPIRRWLSSGASSETEDHC